MSFFFLIVFIIATFIRPQEWVPGMMNVGLVNISAIAMTFFLFIERFSSKRPEFARVPQNGLMMGLFGAILMSHIVHTYFGGLMLAFSLFQVNLILFYLVLNAANTEGKLKTVIWLIVIINVLMAFQGIQQEQTGWGWAGQPPYVDRQTGQVRITWVGIFSDPNDLALILVVAMGFLMAFIFGKTSALARFLSLGMSTVILYAVYLTNSRGGMLALMATLFFYFVRRSRHYIMGSLIGGGAALAVFTLGPSRKAILNVQEASAYSRAELWYQGILMMKSNPLFGVGFRMFDDQLPQTAHNSYILAGSELGLVGLFFFMALIYISFRQLSMVMEKVPSLATYAHGLQSALIGFCAAAFFLSRTYTILPYLLFALSGAMAHIAYKVNTANVVAFKGREIKMTAFLSLSMILMTYVIVKIAL